MRPCETQAQIFPGLTRKGEFRPRRRPGALFVLSPLPASLLGVIAVLALTYLALVQVVKTRNHVHRRLFREFLSLHRDS